MGDHKAKGEESREEENDSGVRDPELGTQNSHCAHSGSHPDDGDLPRRRRPQLLSLPNFSNDDQALLRSPAGKGHPYMGRIGLTDREDGDLGPIYGFQWRHFGARYSNVHADYTGQGFDQLLDVIDKIKNNPDDRRIILSAWNPADLKMMALPPCHMFAQFYVAGGELSCQMYQRSADMGLGVPFNIASYSLLTCMITHVCDLVPGDLIHVIGDTHVYRTHIRPLQEQLQKLPKPFPILKINPQKKNIDSFVAADFELIG